MRSLRDLLTTWENWSARDTLTRALNRVSTDEGREALRHGLAETPEVDPLDALRDAAELVSLLSGWQWQAMHAARVAGASWEQIGGALTIAGRDAQAQFAAALDRQESVQPGTTSSFRTMM